jgi:hypothetical protein
MQFSLIEEYSLRFTSFFGWTSVVGSSDNQLLINQMSEQKLNIQTGHQLQRMNGNWIFRLEDNDAPRPQKNENIKRKAHKRLACPDQKNGVAWLV